MRWVSFFQRLSTSVECFSIMSLTLHRILFTHARAPPCQIFFARTIWFVELHISFMALCFDLLFVNCFLTYVFDIIIVYGFNTSYGTVRLIVFTWYLYLSLFEIVYFFVNFVRNRNFFPKLCFLNFWSWEIYFGYFLRILKRNKNLFIKLLESY